MNITGDRCYWLDGIIGHLKQNMWKLEMTSQWQAMVHTVCLYTWCCCVPVHYISHKWMCSMLSLCCLCVCACVCVCMHAVFNDSSQTNSGVCMAPLLSGLSLIRVTAYLKTHTRPKYLYAFLFVCLYSFILSFSAKCFTYWFQSILTHSILTLVPF